MNVHGRDFFAWAHGRVPQHPPQTQRIHPPRNPHHHRPPSPIPPPAHYLRQLTPHIRHNQSLTNPNQQTNKPSPTQKKRPATASLFTPKVGRVGVEPTRKLLRRILSPLRLPFRHRPISSLSGNNVLFAQHSFYCTHEAIGKQPKLYPLTHQPHTIPNV
jgi:hypothetical protein